MSIPLSMTYQKRSKDQLAARVAQDIPEGAVVNLGIGIHAGCQPHPGQPRSDSAQRKRHLGMGLQIVQTQQPTVSYQDQATQIRKPVHHFFEDRQQGLGLSRIVVKDLVINRQTFTCLHHPPA